MPDTVAGLIGADVGPEQGGQTVAGVDLARADRQNGEQGLDLLAQDEGSRPRGRPHFEAPQQHERESSRYQKPLDYSTAPRPLTAGRGSDLR